MNTWYNGEQEKEEKLGLAGNRYKLLVVDIDGTLLNIDNTISDIDKKALNDVAASGTMVSLSTGRVVQATLRFLDQLHLDGYHVFFDGALVYNPEKKEEVYVDPIPPELISEMIDYSRAVGLDFDLYSITRFFAERETWATDIRRDFFKLNATIVDFREIQDTERFIKGTLVVSSPEDKLKANGFCEHFKDRLSFSWTITPAYPDVDFINILASDVSKGKALRSLTSFLGISTDEVAAIGDGKNDISLLSSAGLAIAMDNAPDELKAIADHVTLDVGRQGVAAAVKRYLL
jgi:Cof subfamily protein (haloacid dehalogenase superfamily)